MFKNFSFIADSNSILNMKTSITFFVCIFLSSITFGQILINRNNDTLNYNLDIKIDPKYNYSFKDIIPYLSKIEGFNTIKDTSNGKMTVQLYDKFELNIVKESNSNFNANLNFLNNKKQIIDSLEEVEVKSIFKEISNEVLFDNYFISIPLNFFQIEKLFSKKITKISLGKQSSENEIQIQEFINNVKKSSLLFFQVEENWAQDFFIYDTLIFFSKNKAKYQIIFNWELKSMILTDLTNVKNYSFWFSKNIFIDIKENEVVKLLKEKYLLLDRLRYYRTQLQIELLKKELIQIEK